MLPPPEWIAGEHLQIVFERLRGVAVARDGEHEAVVATRGFGDAQRERARAGRSTPEGALLAGFRARRGGKIGSIHRTAEFSAGATRPFDAADTRP